MKFGQWKIEIIQENNRFSAFLSCERYIDYKQLILCWNANNCSVNEFINYIFNNSFIDDAKKTYIESLKSDIANFSNEYNM